LVWEKHIPARETQTDFGRAAEQSEGGRIVGVDPAVITACERCGPYGVKSGLTLASRVEKAHGKDKEEGRR
jgi:hypothetical protein